MPSSNASAACERLPTTHRRGWRFRTIAPNLSDVAAPYLRRPSCRDLSQLTTYHRDLPELRELVDFYRTPTGRKSIELAPELMRQGALIESQIASEHSGLLQQMINARVREIDKLQASE